MDTIAHVDGATLRRVMRHVPSPVTVVTTAAEGELRGVTIGSFTSVSLEPPLISFNVQRDSQAYPALRAAGGFVVHVLSDDQAELSTTFSLPDRSGAEQFEGIAYELSEEGFPVLSGVVAVLHCIPYAFYEAGDHDIVIGEVVRAEVGARTEPLLYFDRSYRAVGDDVSTAERSIRLKSVNPGSSETL